MTRRSFLSSALGCIAAALLPVELLSNEKVVSMNGYPTIERPFTWNTQGFVEVGPYIRFQKVTMGLFNEGGDLIQEIPATQIGEDNISCRIVFDEPVNCGPNDTIGTITYTIS
jgi:hypothetical protein